MLLVMIVAATTDGERHQQASPTATPLTLASSVRTARRNPEVVFSPSLRCATAASLGYAPWSRLPAGGAWPWDPRGMTPSLGPGE